MAITVNGVEITEAMVQAEQENHADAPNPRDATIQELVLRELLLQKPRPKAWTLPTRMPPSAPCWKRKSR
jgi:hypothetical protein